MSTFNEITAAIQQRVEKVSGTDPDSAMAAHSMITFDQIIAAIQRLPQEEVDRVQTWLAGEVNLSR